MKKKVALIIGAGPAGLSMAYDLIQKTDIEPIILEKNNFIGGISTTVAYKGNYMDMGGHRFFTKSKVVSDFWKDIFPCQGFPAKDDILLDRLEFSHGSADPEKTDEVFLHRNRLSRIFYLKKFFNYPISFNLTTIKNLGFYRIIKIGFSYLKALCFPKKEKSLEDFFINRFGKELYQTFFKDYTEKLWGKSCGEISAEWGAQRIKGISVLKIIKSFFVKTNETSLIDAFDYPKFGPGQLYETIAEKIKDAGGKILLQSEVVDLQLKDGKICKVKYKNNNEVCEISPDYVISSMPIKDLFERMKGNVPKSICDVAVNLEYRDFRTVGILVNKLKIKNKTKIKTLNELIPDTWIYIQEPFVKLGRIQIFNNWSPYMVKEFKEQVWIGLEYFCNQADDLWKMPEKDFEQMAIDEAVKIGFIDKEDVLDHTSCRVEKAYPGYFGVYKDFKSVQNYIDSIQNFYPIGRNGLHRYNNMDHSILSAFKTTEILMGQTEKSSVWTVNAEKEYHEG